MRDCKECRICHRVKELSEYRIRKESGKHRSECKECLAQKERDRRTENAETIRQKDKERYYRNIADVKIRSKKYREKNKESIKLKKSLYKKQNRHVCNAAHARRKALKRNASVCWANQEHINSVYGKAKRFEAWLGVSYHVDHIVPITNDLVCGLHNEFNLQILPAVDNIRKSNIFNIEDVNHTLSESDYIEKENQIMLKLNMSAPEGDPITNPTPPQTGGGKSPPPTPVAN